MLDLCQKINRLPQMGEALFYPSIDRDVLTDTAIDCVILSSVTYNLYQMQTLKVISLKQITIHILHSKFRMWENLNDVK